MSEPGPPREAAAPYLRAISHLAIARAEDDFLYCPSSLAGKRARMPGRFLSTHVAVRPEIICTLRGRMDMATPGAVLTLTPSRLLFIEPGVEHGELLHADTEAVFAVLFDTNVHLCMVDSMVPVTPMDLLGTTQLGYLPQAMSRELSLREPDMARSLQGLLAHLACILERRVKRGSYVPLAPPNVPQSGGERAWRLVETVMAYCAAHFRGPVHINEIAAAVGYSRTHVSRLFAQCAGKPISQHLRDLRMAEARDLLGRSDLSVDQIGRQLGYTDQSNFRRAFFAAVGVSPRRYRQGGRLPAPDGLLPGNGRAGRAGPLATS